MSAPRRPALGLAQSLGVAVLCIALLGACGPTSRRVDALPDAAIGPSPRPTQALLIDMSDAWYVDFSAQPARLYLSTYGSSSCPLDAPKIIRHEPGFIAVEVEVSGNHSVCTADLGGPVYSRIELPESVLSTDTLTVKLFDVESSIPIPASARNTG